MEYLPQENTLSWRELPHPNLWASSRAVHIQSPMDKNKQNPCSFASSQGKAEGPFTSRTHPPSNPGFLKAFLQMYHSSTSPFLVLLPSLPLWYYQKHSPINFLQTYLHLEIYFLGTRPQMDFPCSPAVILPLCHQNWLLCLNHIYALFLKAIFKEFYFTTPCNSLPLPPPQ